jgi:hypothetical protein
MATSDGTPEPKGPSAAPALPGVTLLGTRTPDDVTVLAGAGGKRATPEEVRRFVAREQARITREQREARDVGR